VDPGGPRVSQEIARTKPSRPCVEILLGLVTDRMLAGEAPRVLDFGAGRGADVRFLRSIGVQAKAYDPIHGPPKIPGGLFDLVSLIYVLNVVPRAERPQIMRQVAAKTAPGGLVLVAVRPADEVTRQAEASGWPVVEPGGYLPTGSTYQGAIPRAELVALGTAAGLRAVSLRSPAKMTAALFAKPAAR